MRRYIRRSVQLGVSAGLAFVFLALALPAAALQAVTVVRPNDPHGWLLIQEAPAASAVYEAGPLTPPAGAGSLRMTTADNAGRMLLYTTVFTGTRLADLTKLEYATFQSPANSNAAWAISLQLNVDYDLTDANAAWQGRLIFEPYMSGTPAPGGWQSWNALAGRWWASGAPGNTLCPQSTPCTWAQVRANWPNAGIQNNALSGLMFKAGGPWPGFVGNVDAFTIGVANSDQTFDFEPTEQCAALCYVSPQGNDANGGTSPADAKRTIQAGVNQVAAGGTVQIASGVYTESVTIAKDNLTLAGVTGASLLRSPTPGSGTGIALSGARSGVTIRGLSVSTFLDGLGMPTGPLSAITVEDSSFSNNARHGIWVQASPASNLAFRRITASNNDVAPCEPGPGRGLWLINGEKSGITIADSTFNNNCLVGVDISDGSVTGLSLTGNTVRGNGDAGLSVLGAQGPAANLVADNTVTDNGRFGIEVKNPRGQLTVRGNAVARTIPATDARDSAGIAVIRRGPGSLNADQPGPVVIADNTVSGYRRMATGATGDGFGIVAEGLSQTIIGNLVSGNDVGIQVQAGNPSANTQNTDFFDRGNGGAASATVSYNYLTGNGVGLRNVAGTAAVSAATPCNWWGAVSGPLGAANPGGLGQSLVNPTGPHMPWLVAGDDAAPAPGAQLPAAFAISAAGDVSAADNGFRRMANGIGCVVDNQTITLDGEFDWRLPAAAAAWATGVDGVPGNGDDDGILVPPGADGVTLTAASLGAATISGPGDLAAKNLESVLVFDGGPNQGWTISQLRIADFDLAIGMFSGAGGASAFDNTRIISNSIKIATDLNAVAAPADVNQNIGIHLSFGANQTVAGNRLEFAGDGVSAPNANATSVGLQSNTSGGAVYDGLVLARNQLVVTGAQSATPEVIFGLWENAHGHSSDIMVEGNSFTNLAAANDPARNAQRAFRITSHSSATSAVNYAGNTVDGANLGFQWLAGSDFSATRPIIMADNNLTNVGLGMLIQSNGRAAIQDGSVTNTGAAAGLGTGLEIQAGSAVTIADMSFSGLGQAVSASGQLGMNRIAVTGGRDGLLARDAAAVSLGDTAFAGQSGDYITLVNHAADLDGRLASFEGVTGRNMTAAQYAAVQAKIVDENDNPALGLVLLADPRIQVSPTSLAFAGTRGGAPTAAQSFAITGGAAARLEWAVAAPLYSPGGSGWLSCNPPLPASGVVTGTVTMACQALPGSLAAGVYTATLVVSSPSAPGVVTVEATFAVTAPSVVIAAAPLAVQESGPTTDTYRLRLGAAPSAPVTLTLSAAGGQVELSVDGGQTFGASRQVGWTAAGWQTERTIVVRAIDDTAIEGPHSAAISSAVATGSASEYLGLAIDPVAVAIADNDPLAVTALAGNNQQAIVNTAFGTALQVRVLDAAGQPAAGVTVTFAAPASGASGLFANGQASATAVTGA
ncbi:MAG TPA: right-handed parallel beta-helix repeat-containing protein, partial [Herpetosiphonaceae bacterium]